MLGQSVGRSIVCPRSLLRLFLVSAKITAVLSSDRRLSLSLSTFVHDFAYPYPCAYEHALLPSSASFPFSSLRVGLDLTKSCARSLLRQHASIYTHSIFCSFVAVSSYNLCLGLFVPKVPPPPSFFSSLDSQPPFPLSSTPLHDKSK